MVKEKIMFLDLFSIFFLNLENSKVMVKFENYNLKFCYLDQHTYSQFLLFIYAGSWKLSKNTNFVFKSQIPKIST